MSIHRQPGWFFLIAATSLWVAACTTPAQTRTAAPATAPACGLVAACSAQNTPSPAPQSSPTVTTILLLPGADWLPYSSSKFGLSVRYPPNWQLDTSGNAVYSGPDGFFQITAAQSPSAKAICQYLVDNIQTNPESLDVLEFGRQPAQEISHIDGQPACLLFPSDDQAASDRNLALLLVEYPQSVKPGVVLQFWADKYHIRALATTLSFFRPTPSGPPTEADLLPVATPRPTITSTPTPVSSPTIAPTPKLESLTFDVTRSTSPDKSWIAQFEVSAPVASREGENYQRFVIVRLINTARNLEWVPTREWWGAGLGEGVPEVLHWSADGTYILLSVHSWGDGCPGFGVQGGVRRVDLATGAIETLSGTLNGVISVSPDEKTIAILGYDWIKLYEAATARLTFIAFPSNPAYAPSGNVVWSPDSQAFAFITDYGFCSDPPAISVWKVDLASTKPHLLLKEYPGRFTIREWMPNNQILLSDPDGSQLALDSETDQILSPR